MIYRLATQDFLLLTAYSQTLWNGLNGPNGLNGLNAPRRLLSH